MNKAELVDAVREAAGLERRQAESAVEAVVDAIVSSVKAGERVSIPRFGTFNVSNRAARTGRNPQTGAPVKIAASKGVRFAPASAFKEALNAKKGAAAKKAAPAKATAKKAGGSKRAAPAKSAAKSSSTSKKTAPAKKAAKSTKKR